MEKVAEDSGCAKGSCLASIYAYILYFMIIYGLFVGFRMSNLLSAGLEVPSFVKSSHVHIILISFMLLFVAYDLKIKNRLECLNVWLGEVIIGVAVFGHILASIGFSIAAFIPSGIPLGLKLVHWGLPIMFLAFLAYVIAAIIAEMYR